MGRTKREKEKVEKIKKDDVKADLIIDVDDESSKEDITQDLSEATASLSLKDVSGGESVESSKEKRVKKSYRERREERERKKEVMEETTADSYATPAESTKKQAESS